MQRLIKATEIKPGMILCFEPARFNYMVEEVICDSVYGEVKIVSGNDTRVDWLMSDDKVWASYQQ
jgi:hypothetical protein